MENMVTEIRNNPDEMVVTNNINGIKRNTDTELNNYIEADNKIESGLELNSAEAIKTSNDEMMSEDITEEVKISSSFEIEKMETPTDSSSNLNSDNTIEQLSLEKMETPSNSSRDSNNDNITEKLLQEKMETSSNSHNDNNITEQLSPEMYKIVESLTQNPEIQFKSQQRGEEDPTPEEKTSIAAKILNTNKLKFLLRFGKHLNTDHVELIRNHASKCEKQEIDLIIKNLEDSNKKRKRCCRNRRYEALKRLIEEDRYFSESEMMKRNPLLYDQLVGQYLTEEERRQRDRADSQDTFVKILMEGIERDNARDFRKKQEEEEDDAMEEEDSDSSDEDTIDKKKKKSGEEEEEASSTSKWGEFLEDDRINKEEFYPTKRSNKTVLITAPERTLLREEFVTLMHQSFLDGKDEDFDYAKVDEDEQLDNLDIVGHDEEDKYFDSEEPHDAELEEGVGRKEESSEDELDIYMNALNQHPAVCALSNELNKKL